MLMEEKNKIDHYTILGVARDATLDEIVHSYRTLAKKYHPDVPKGDEHNFKLLSQAYNILRDPKERQKYDAEINSQMHGQHASYIQLVFNDHFFAYFVGVGIVYVGIIFAFFFVFDFFNFLVITVAMAIYGVVFFVIFKKMIIGDG